MAKHLHASNRRRPEGAFQRIRVRIGSAGNVGRIPFQVNYNPP
jgi:hypothetical protein